MPRPIKFIATAYQPDYQHTVLFAVCADDTIWRIDDASNDFIEGAGWKQLPSIPSPSDLARKPTKEQLAAEGRI